MKKLLIAIFLTLSSFALMAQAKDSVLLVSKLGLKMGGEYNTGDGKATILFTHVANKPSRVVFKMDDNPDSTGTVLTIGDLTGTRPDTDGTYYYYAAKLTNTSEDITFAIKYNTDGKTFNSFGIIRESQQSIVVFYIDNGKSL